MRCAGTSEVITALLVWGLATAEARPRRVTVPVDIGVGPSAHLITGPVFRDQPVHTGLSLSVQAIIDKKTLRKYRKRIPAKYRKMVMQMEEVRYSPFIWLPDTLIISPAYDGTGMYGASWRPLSIGLTWSREPVRFVTSIGGPRITYLFIHSRTLASPTHFLRPGLDARADLEIPFSDTVLLSARWTSELYPPQQVGGSILEWGPPGESIWHVGQATLMLHIRFPYTTRL